MDEIIVNNLPENDSPNQADQTLVIRNADGTLTIVTLSVLKALIGGAVESVNGKTGEVDLSAEDVGALPDTYEAPVTSVNGKTGAVDLTAEDVGAATPEDVYAVYPTDRASGPIAHFTDGAEDIPVKSLIVEIEPIQSGSGDPSPDNVRPISGRTGLTLSHSGVDTADPEEIEIDWTDTAGTVYGGTLNVTTGVLTVDRLTETLPSDGNWQIASTSLRRVFQRENALSFSHPNIAGQKLLSDTMRASLTVSDSSQNVEYWSVRGGNYVSKNIFVITPASLADMTVDQFKQFLAEHPTRVSCRMASPVTYQLTSVEVKTLLGENNLWADAGDVNVEYRADVKLYIQKLTAPTEDDMAADANIQSGKYFVVGNTLYLATQSIASGQAIVPGTNCTRVSLADALNAINT